MKLPTRQKDQIDKNPEAKRHPSAIDLAFQAFLVSFQEAHTYLRDTSRQIEEHVKFYLTVATALTGAAVYPFVAGSNETITKAVLFGGSLVLSGLGIIIFLRLVRKKVQATQQTAWGIRVEYGMFLMAFGANNRDVEKPSPTPIPAHFPISAQVIFILTAFAIFNSVVLSISTLAFISMILQAGKQNVFSLNEFYFMVYGIPSLLSFVLSLIIQRMYLRNQLQEAHSEYERIVSPPIPKPE